MLYSKSIHIRMCTFSLLGYNEYPIGVSHTLKQESNDHISLNIQKYVKYYKDKKTQAITQRRAATEKRIQANKELEDQKNEIKKQIDKLQQKLSNTISKEKKNLKYINQTAKEEKEYLEALKFIEDNQ